MIYLQSKSYQWFERMKKTMKQIEEWFKHLEGEDYNFKIKCLVAELVYQAGRNNDEEIRMMANHMMHLLTLRDYEKAKKEGVSE